MKKILTSTVVVLALVFTVNAWAKKQSDSALTEDGGAKLGYVDLNTALNEVDEGKTAKAKLEADGKAKKQKLEIMQNDIKKMKGEIDKQRLILSAEALREKEVRLQQSFMELQKKTMEFEQDFARKEAEYIKPISDKLQMVINEIGSKEGYSLIVPKEMALYSLPGTDLTSRVITAYNKKK